MDTTDQVEEEMWEFFTEDVVTTINTYHAIPTQQQLSKEDVEQLLCEGVDGIQTCRVKCITLTL